MADWYFYDANGYKIGPIKGRELKQSAQQGLITPETVVEDENGRTVLAKQVTGLTFGNETVQSRMATELDNSSAIAAPLPPAQTVPIPPIEPSQNEAYTQAAAAFGQAAVQAGHVAKALGQSAAKTSLFAWLTDFSFQNLRLELVILWIYRILYAVGLIVATLAFLACCSTTILGAFAAIADSRGASLLMLLLIPFLCIGFILFAIYWRVICEMGVIFLTWYVDVAKLTKATRIYVENKNTEQENKI